MRYIKVSKTILILMAYLVSGWFIIDPAPLPMALFVFVAQPLLLFAAILYVAEVLMELRQRGIL
jgi:hypothetical protein